jgi:hypothetical protein
VIGVADKDIKRDDIAQKQRQDPNRDWTKNYDESDVAHVLKASDAHNWNDAIKYLDRNGMNDNELTPGETIHMKEDLQKAVKGKAGFSGDPKQAYKALRGSSASRSSSKRH